MVDNEKRTHVDYQDTSAEEVKAELEGKLDRNKLVEEAIRSESHHDFGAIDKTANDENERFGDWHETYTGLKFWTLSPKPEEIRIEDIAHALSYMCRFNGHCSRFYSVGQHSIHCLELARRKGIENNETLLYILLHDASEAYIADLIRPVKRFMPEYKRVEEELQNKIYLRFGLGVPMAPKREEVVKYIDNLMLANEAKQLVPSGGIKWSLIELEDENVFQLANWDFVTVEMRYLREFQYLSGKVRRAIP